MDGTPTLRMNEFFLASLAKGKADLGPPKTSSTTTDLPAPTELVFATDAQVQGPIKDAEARFDTLVRAHDLHVQHYEGYGKSLIKTHRISPDAWAQLTKQLAFHKMHGRLGVTYESAQTRKFSWGPTEVIRSASTEAKGFVEGMRGTPAPHGAAAQCARDQSRGAPHALCGLGGGRAGRGPPFVWAEEARGYAARGGGARVLPGRGVWQVEPLGAEHKPAEQPVL
ncbi:hypothetical protein H0H87_010290 [Tephrocybe sp. NHM501043]|nr:hypothetical protein H0H87_009923 [Tephrocybe sp. NHM501043]KAG6852326.1 hypothetical protein H0H87_010290 [Tephrocybe sp. NHM501043]